MENRIIIIFAHLSIILKCLKINQNNKEISQSLYDNVFHNIENNLREIGHGDVTVNKKMKQLNQIFHDLLIKFIDDRTKKKIEIKKWLNFSI